LKNILILGASILQLPAIQKAKALGYFVGVVDSDPDALGIRYADRYFGVSTIDTQRVVEAAVEFQADGIMTLATDMPVRSIAVACEALGLPGLSLDTAIKSTDKGEMMQAFKAHAVSHPWFIISSSIDQLDSMKDSIEYPCVVKPTDNSGSRGVVLVNDENEMFGAYEYSQQQSRSGKIIVQEYLRGNEVSVEVVVRNGIPHALAVTDKITSGSPHFVEMGHSQPSKLGANTVVAITDLACQAIKAVGIHNGPAHVEIMVTQSGPVMIELGARMGGDFIASHLVPLSTGVDMVEAVIHQSCGERFDLHRKHSKGSVAKYLEVPRGKIAEIDGIEQARRIPGVRDVIMMKRIGDIVGDVSCSADRAGVVIAQGEDVYLAENACQQAIQRLRVTTK